MQSRRTGVVAAGAVSLMVLLGACGSDDTPAAGSPAGSDVRLNVVASTNVYGDIAEQVAGDEAQVTSIITNPEADPHSYEATTQDRLTLSKADVVVWNGGGYDEFVPTLLTSADNDDVEVLEAVAVSGRTAPAGEELNEHVWYDLPAMAKLADRLATELAAKDPADASAFTAAAAAFKQKLSTLETTEATIRSAGGGAGVAITEPVPVYLLEACGLENRTPEEFSEAVEEGDDISPTVLKQTLDLFTTKQVKLLAYNEQTVGPETQQILKAAQANGIPVASFTETLPQGQGYVSWMTANLAAVQKALGTS